MQSIDEVSSNIDLRTGNATAVLPAHIMYNNKSQKQAKIVDKAVLYKEVSLEKGRKLPVFNLSNTRKISFFEFGSKLQIFFQSHARFEF